LSVKRRGRYQSESQTMNGCAYRRTSASSFPFMSSRSSSFDFKVASTLFANRLASEWATWFMRMARSRAALSVRDDVCEWSEQGHCAGECRKTHVVIWLDVGRQPFLQLFVEGCDFLHRAFFSGDLGNLCLQSAGILAGSRAPICQHETLLPGITDEVRSVSLYVGQTPRRTPPAGIKVHAN
jgi:hypothetical protein